MQLVRDEFCLGETLEGWRARRSSIRSGLVNSDSADIMSDKVFRMHGDTATIVSSQPVPWTLSKLLMNTLSTSSNNCLPLASLTLWFQSPSWMATAVQLGLPLLIRWGLSLELTCQATLTTSSLCWKNVTLTVDGVWKLFVVEAVERSHPLRDLGRWLKRKKWMSMVAN